MEMFGPVNAANPNVHALNECIRVASAWIHRLTITDRHHRPYKHICIRHIHMHMHMQAQAHSYTSDAQ